MITTCPRHYLQFTEITEHFRVIVAYSHHPRTVTRTELGQGQVLGLIHMSFARRNWSAVRIRRRLADRGRHSIHQLIRRGMLETLGLIVHAVPRIMQRAREVRFNHAMTPERAKCRPPAKVGERNAAIAFVGE